MYEVLETIQTTYSGKEAEILTKAFYFAKEAHANQKRASGEEYFTHPCAVAQILIELGMDCSTIAAAFLHDTIEDTYVSEGDIKKEFGEEILQLVQGVTKLEKIEFKSHEEEQAENFKKIFVSMAKDIRVIIIKLADRLHNMRSLNFLSSERQQRISKETLDIYAPLAGRLGISQIKCELEDLCLKYLDPEAYEFLATNINSKLAERRKFVDFVIKEIQEILAESNLQGEVFGRPKHFYSIYKKMKNQGKTLDQIYDLTAVRVIVNEIDECYELLGKIHKKWKPIPGRIKDYIAMPKPNMYQSLHTTVVTDFGQTFEIQIRTKEMHRMAEYGIAAHWKYKENKTVEDNFDTRLSWIREVMEWQGGVKDSKEFLESLKGDVYSSEVLVFTPKGEVKSLVKDATPIDFAYSVHTEVGHHCVGAKVNGKMVPLNTVLQTGDVVDIITSKTSKGPSWDWLKIAKSAGSKNKIRQFFRREMHDENIKIGKSMLEAEARNKGYNFGELLNPVSFERIQNKMSFSTPEEMYMAVGGGIVTVNQVLVKLIDVARKETAKDDNRKFVSTHHSSTGDVIVKGVEGLLIRFAGCCNPVPGDKIIGFISRGRGVTVHRADCPNMKNETPDRIVEAVWSGKVGSDYIVSIEIHAEESASVLQVVSGICAQLNLFITSVNGRIDTKLRISIVDMTIRLNTAGDLDTLIKKISAEKGIIEVFRV
ncbi:MAG: bifunctional (p)ppGpp synthetase/guanosine-3',5'-bis(diphosphate) 3'-pyrophosphohydrolase [Christensenellaceae bacterium]|nr:bifunctional (p)ppGpp synthetase/guanosine-3',5'-bis(diphosphate) 3'-pyrophosphohydrolase [Christensenellaceae bacterium]MDD6926263.1 bifunctional (p)ppGpp synthetase/guanosine-3',5'-bis(diphosphate) 3'-pyrophosphohydrolase [bacterium]MDY2851057.1 bifunctional (p)ppGpp synthetase/guanosine-3',5'-bis(diphosphate) 3'-pyrophosphohydrolase [Christensenellaceae bacterium]